MLLEILGSINQPINLEEINILSSDGRKRAESYGVKSVPTIVINMREKITGMPKRNQLIKVLGVESNRRLSGA